jgi:diguanylate cyclase (GGDEF)-like protein
VDGLTGALNSREFYRQVELELLQAARHQRAVSIAYLDLDNFKQVNDNFGHNSGDELLRAVADCIRTNLRRTDLLARMGGDEFAIFLPETDTQAVEAVVAKIRLNLKLAMQGREYPVTFSLGAISFGQAPGSVDDILRQADLLMYTVKAAGKDSYMVVRG